MMAKKTGEVNMEEDQISCPNGQRALIPTDWLPIPDPRATKSPESIADDYAARSIHRFGQATADRPQNKRRDFAFRS
jgi:hypothetical protein